MKKIIVAIFALMLIFLQESWAFHKSIYEPRVPAKILEELQDMDNPYPASPERIKAGKQIYHGKGLCVTCHDKNGKGKKAPGHSPRDFTDRKWQELRTDGEMMWILRNGSPGTSMPVRVGKVINEEEAWTVIHFIRTFVDSEKESN